MKPRAQEIAELRSRVLRGENLPSPYLHWSYNQGRAGGGEPPPPAAAALHIWELDDANGTAINDTGTGEQSLGSSSGGSLEYGLSPLTSGGAGSIGFPQAGYIGIPNVADMRTAEWTISGVFQVDATAAGLQQMIVAMDAGLPPGGFTIDLFDDGIYAYTRKAAGSFGSSWWLGTDGSSGSRPASPMTTITAGVAYRFMLTVDSGGAEFWLWADGDSEPSTPIATSGNTEGLVSNTAELAIGAYHSGAAVPFNGVISQISMWDRACGTTELGVAPLAGPTSITHSDTTPRDFTLKTSGARVDTDFKDLGELTGSSAVATLADSDSPAYDLTGTILTSTFTLGSPTPPSASASSGDVYSPVQASKNRNILNTADSTGGGIFGATIKNGYGLTFGAYDADSCGRRYPSNSGGQLSLLQGATTDFMIEGCRFHHCWDPIRIGGMDESPPNDQVNLKIFRCWFTKVYDDCIEDDNFRAPTVEECLIDGCYVAISERSSGRPQANRIVVVKNCLIRLEQLYDVDDHYFLFKWASNSNMLTMTDCVIAFDKGARSASGSLKDPFLDIAQYGKMLSWANNTVVWLGSGSYPYQSTLPSGVTSTTDASVWTDAVAAWKAANPHVPRISGVDT